MSSTPRQPPIDPGGTVLLGATSMVGWGIHQAWSGPLLEAFCNQHVRHGAPGCHRIDLEDAAAVSNMLRELRPSTVIHCAAVCRVAKCEASPEFAYQVNVQTTRNLLASLPRKTRLIYCSSDHVFSGDGGPYTERSVPDPLSVYGRTRVAAERVVADHGDNTLILRTGLSIGPSFGGRTGHLDWLRFRHQRGLPMTIVEDEHRSAVWSAALGQRIVALARSRLTGVRHVVASRVVSRPQLADYLIARFEIGATYTLEARRQRAAPHLGHVDLRTTYDDGLAQPLPSVVPLPATL